MAEFLYADLAHQGDNAPYARRIYMQMDRLSAKEASDYQGANPHFLKRFSTRHLQVNDVTLVQLGDLVIDNAVIDPKTQVARRFRIVSDPQPKALMMSWTWVAEQMRGR